MPDFVVFFWVEYHKNTTIMLLKVLFEVQNLINAAKTDIIKKGLEENFSYYSWKYEKKKYIK